MPVNSGAIFSFLSERAPAPLTGTFIKDFLGHLGYQADIDELKIILHSFLVKQPEDGPLTGRLLSDTLNMAAGLNEWVSVRTVPAGFHVLIRTCEPRDPVDEMRPATPEEIQALQKARRSSS
jgi:hypothetical protein